MVLPIALARLLPAREDDPPKRYPVWLAPDPQRVHRFNDDGKSIRT